MPRRRRLLVPALALALFVATAPPAVADQSPREVDPPPGIVADFGRSSIHLGDAAGRRLILDVPGNRTDGDGAGVRYRGEGFALRSHANGAWVTTLIDIAAPEAPTAYEFRLRLPPGWSLSLQDDGSIAILGAGDEREGTVAPPWAHDGAGADVPTHFSIEDGATLVQTVEHHGAEYPVTADPSVTLGRNVYLWARGHEIGWWGTSSAAFLSSYLCAAYGALHPVLCAVSAVGALWLIKAFDDVFSRDLCRYVIALRYWGWPNYMERLDRYGCTYRKSEIPG